MAQHGTGLEQLPQELIQVIFKCFSAKPQWSRQDPDYSTPLKTISLTSHFLRRSVFARLFDWIKINVTVAGQTLRPSHISVIRDLRAFIIKYRSQLRVEGLKLLIRVVPNDDQDVLTQQGLSFTQKPGFWESDSLVAAIFDRIFEVVNPASLVVVCEPIPVGKSSMFRDLLSSDEALPLPFSAVLLSQGKVKKSPALHMDKKPSHLLMRKRNWVHLVIAESPYLGHTAYENFRAHTPSFLRSVQYKPLVSMARQFTTLKSFHYVSPFCTPPMMLRHVFTFLNCVLSLEELRLVLVPGRTALTNFTMEGLESGGNQVAASYKKFARIARSKGDHQRLGLFKSADYAPSELSIDVSGIIDQELVGWANKGEGVWEKVGKEEAKDDGK